MPLADIIAQQQRWARTQWPGHSTSRAPTLAANLITEMSPEFAAQFGGGNGGELGRDGRPGKMQSLRSSSALAFNVFAPWHGRDVSALASALQTRLHDRAVAFERKYPHGLSSAPPNLDVVLDGLQSRPLAIESKFTEPYGNKPPDPPLDDKYFPGNRERWGERGLPRCQRLAAAAGKNIIFSRLGVGQLLKHVLGLAHTTRERPRLLCLWFDSGCSEAETHRAELRQFADAVGDEIEFSHLTYQDVIARFSPQSDPIPGYCEYLRARYAAATAQA